MSHPIARLLGLVAPVRPVVRYLSLCSGIEAASTAWHAMGWQPLAFSEIEPFPSAVLAHHWPHVPNLGDMTKWREWPEDLLAQVDVLVGGTPCQAFSVAGLRNSLSDERGNLTLIYAHLLDHLDTLRAARGLPPVICLWENVPGVLSTKDNAFGCFLGALAGEESALEPPGTKWSNAGWVLGPQRAITWRTLDAQYFGVAQRRRRVFLVASARTGFSPEAVLFEFQGVRRDSPPSREKRESHTYELAPCLAASGRGFERTGDPRGQDCCIPTYWDGGQVSQTLDAVLAKGQTMPEKNRFPAVLVPDTAHTLRAEGFDASEDGTGRGTPLVPVGIGVDGFNGAVTGDVAATTGTCGSSGTASGPQVMVAYRVHGENSTAMQGNGDARVADPVEVARCLDSCGGYATNQGGNIVAFSCKDHGGDASGIAPTLRSMGHDGSHANGGGQVAVAFAQNTRDEVREMQVVGALAAQPGMKQTSYIRQTMQVRRLTPTECERLQGFPDGHTLIPWKKKPAGECPDGPRYKALGNSMAVPCMAWIGRRIQNNLPTP